MSDKEKLKELMEALVGVDAESKYTFLEILQYVDNLKSIEERYYDSKKT